MVCMRPQIETAMSPLSGRYLVFGLGLECPRTCQDLGISWFGSPPICSDASPVLERSFDVYELMN